MERCLARWVFWIVVKQDIFQVLALGENELKDLLIVARARIVEQRVHLQVVAATFVLTLTAQIGVSMERVSTHLVIIQLAIDPRA